MKGSPKCILTEKMQKELPPYVFQLLKDIGKLADELNEGAFVVGGFVRDLLLGIKNFDIDIVVEADAVDFAKRLADRLNAALVVYKRFRTASIIIKRLPGVNMQEIFGRAAIKIDLATARKEFYQRPAALPIVCFATVKDDLLRRDFTINSMAISLNNNTFGWLVDFFGGKQDLRNKTIKVLHDLSFVDDPTRIFRAVRLRQRLAFKIEQHTEALIQHAITLDMFAKTQKQRLREEIILLLSEPRPLGAILKMSELDELRFIHPNLGIDKKIISLFSQVEDVCKWFLSEHLGKRKLDEWILYFLALVDNLNLSEVIKICKDFIFRKSDEKRILIFKKNSVKLIKFLNSIVVKRPSRIYKVLEPLPYEVILMCMAKLKTQYAKEKIRLFLERYNGAKLHINGGDLLTLGFVPGPRFKEVLNKALYAKLDGKIGSTKRDEIEFARKLI